MSLFTPMASAVSSAAKKGSKPGMFDEVTTGIRRYDPVMSARMFGSINRMADQAGQGLYNRGRRDLLAGGGGRSGRMLTLGRQAADLQAKTGYEAMTDWGAREQQFTENARQFDTQTALALKEMFLRKKMQEDASKMNFGQFMGNVVGAGGQAASGYFGRG